MSSSHQVKLDLSTELFTRAVELIPGGVNSPVRAFRAVGGTPRFIKSALGAMMTDADGRAYIDYVGSWGPMILGHANPEVVEALREALARGTSYGAPTELEIEMAEEIIDAVPSVEMVRMVNSGTEAVMSVIRLARGVTGRTRIVKFEGCITVTAIRCWCAPVRASVHFLCPIRPACPLRSPAKPSPRRLMTEMRSNEFSMNIKTGSRRLSSNRSLATWAASRRARDF